MANEKERGQQRRDANQRYQLEQDALRLAREHDVRIRSTISILNAVLMSDPDTPEGWERTKEFCSIYALVGDIFPVIRKFWESVRDDPDTRVLICELVDVGRHGIAYRELAESVGKNLELMGLFRRAESG